MSEKGDKTFLANVDTEFDMYLENLDLLIEYAWVQVDERIAEIRELERNRKRLVADWMYVDE
tara:strand:+ start:480 stop:665 length:186 start_codon:yes stop_codon:yes gene_type:complete